MVLLNPAQGRALGFTLDSLVYDRVHAFLDRPLEGDWPDLRLDQLRPKVSMLAGGGYLSFRAQAKILPNLNDDREC